MFEIKEPLRNKQLKLLMYRTQYHLFKIILKQIS